MPLRVSTPFGAIAALLLVAAGLGANARLSASQVPDILPFIGRGVVGALPDVVPAQPIEMPQVDYPANLDAAVAGEMFLDAIVLPDGTVANVAVLQAVDKEHVLDPLVESVARRWRFAPARKAGSPVPAHVTLLQYFSPRRGAGAALVSRLSVAYPTIGQGIVEPEPVYQERANYNYDAMVARIRGEATVHVIIDATGTVIAARILKSLDPNHGLDAEALRAARAWRFKPGTLDGRPVAFSFSLIFTFNMR